MNRKISIFLILSLTVTFAFSQDKNIGIKLNFGTSFSKPKDDLGKAAVSGKEMQPILNGEVSYFLGLSQKTKFGIKFAAVTGYDMANFISNDYLTQLKVSVPNLRARIYPFSASGDFYEALEKVLPEKLPFLLEIPVWISIAASLNSLHFDYGVGFGKILETDYAETGFQDVTVTRTMKYVGWGLQPQIFHSESGKWTVNAFFDFGKFSWTNASGGTSSFKSDQLGFGVQYNL